MDWSELYPAFVEYFPTGLKKLTEEPNGSSHPPKLSSEVTIADIGCGFGGLLFALSPKFPSTLLLGLEIRSSVSAFVQDKIRAARSQAIAATTTTKETTSSEQNKENEEVEDPKGPFQNIACLRANGMKFLPNLFRRAQLSAVFLCFPDPHFKARKHKARIVSAALASEYAYILRPGTGKMYTVTDVEDLHAWIVQHVTEHPSFERMDQQEVDQDECVRIVCEETEEGKKVQRNGGRKFVAVFRRLEDPEWPEE